MIPTSTPPTARFLFASLFAFCLAHSSGCSSSVPSPVESQPTQVSASLPAATFSVAVIDLDRVAEGIGAVEKMRQALAQFEQKTIADLQQSTAHFFGDQAPTGTDFATFDKMASPLVDALPEDQQREFVASVRAAQSQLLVRQQQLRKDFLNEVRPYAFQIARDQGCPLVLTTDQVYVATEQMDITDSVIRRITQINASATATSSSPSASPPAKLASGGSFPIH